MAGLMQLTLILKDASSQASALVSVMFDPQRKSRKNYEQKITAAEGVLQSPTVKSHHCDTVL